MMPEPENTTERPGGWSDAGVGNAGDSRDNGIRIAGTLNSCATATDPRTAEKLNRLAAKIRSDAIDQAADYVLRHNTSHDGE